MTAQPDQVAFWNSAASSRRFTHTLDLARFTELLPRAARVLDYGCGQGRLLGDLAEAGFTQLTGVDSSTEMVRAAKAAHPQVEVCVNDGATLPFDAASFDAVLLFAVLTCIVADDAQRQLIAGLHRVLRPGGWLVISDYPLQTDARNVARYGEFADRLGGYGRFELPDGAQLRHHRSEWFAELLGDFDIAHREEKDAVTMNGNPARVVQIWARKR